MEEPQKQEPTIPENKPSKTESLLDLDEPS